MSVFWYNNKIETTKIRMTPLPHKKIALVLSIFLCTIAVIWRFFVADIFLGLAKDFSYEAELIAVDNFYDSQAQSYLGEEYSSATFKYKTVSSTKIGDIIENSFHVTTITGEEVISIKREYGINPHTGAHLSELGDKVRDGYLFAPKGLKPGQTFTYWHVNYDGPATMTYTGQETLEGLNLYTYETHYENVPIDQTSDLSRLEGVPEKWGVELEPYLKLWIEPVTGSLIKYEDETTAYYYDNQTGERLNPWNHFSNTFTEEATSQKIAEAKIAKIKGVFVQTGVPLLFLSLSGLTILIYFLKKPSKGIDRFSIHWLIHVFFVSFPLVLMLVCFYLVDAKMDEKNDLEFKNRVSQIEEAIIRKTDIAVNTLEGIQGLFQASENVSREEWSVYIQELDIIEKYPGIKAVGYASIVSSSELESHVASMQAEGAEGYTIWPELVTETYSLVTYIAPITPRNTNLLGYNGNSNPVRVAAMEFARDSGAPSLSGKLTFPAFSEEDPKTGTASALFIPIYKKGLPLSNLDERRAAITGYAFASFWIEDFINGIFGSTPLGINFKIHDGTEVNEETLMYEYIETSDSKKQDPIRTARSTIFIAGHPWTISFEALDEFNSSDSQRWMSYGLLGLGVVLCALHIFIYFTLVTSRGRLTEGANRTILRERKKR